MRIRGVFFLRELFIPSNFTLIYIFFLLISGAYFLPRYEALYGMSAKYASITSLRLSSSFFLFTNLVLFFTIPFEKISQIDFKTSIRVRLKDRHLLLASLIFLVSIFFEINLSYFGGNEGLFNFPFILMAFIILSINISGFRSFKKIGIYLFCIILFISKFYGSKREIFFVLITIGIIESSKTIKPFKLNLKKCIIIFLALSCILLIVLISSILRGYGGFGDINIFEALFYVDDYLQNPKIISYLLNNLEISYGYFHTMNVFELIETSKISYTYGETLIKPLFIAFPREVFKFKPDSMVSIYTTAFDPSFRKAGGSFPVNFVSEVFLNLWYFGLVFLLFLFKYLNRVYMFVLNGLIENRVSLKLLIGIFTTATIIQFVRGAGIELWLIYMIFGSLFAILYQLITKNITRL
jgi:hypothetical protein